MSLQLGGVLPILHTPFTEQDTIDWDVLKAEIDWVFATGADGVCSAMVSEILRLCERERLEYAERMVEFSQGRGPVIASVGSETTRQACLYAREAQAAGCAAIMAIPPISTALPERALKDYFTALADCVDLPLIVQDASSYVGRAMTPQFMADLMNAYSPDKIQFKPEAAPIGPNLSALREATDGRARMFDGSGGLLLVDAYRRGIAGTMPGCDLLDVVVALWRSLTSGNEEHVRLLAPPLCTLVALQLQAGLDGFLAIEKYLMRKRGLFPNELRRQPVAWELDSETAQGVDDLFAELQRLLESLEPSSVAV